MKLLLDTHIALWAVSDDPRLSPKARELIATPRNLIWVSDESRQICARCANDVQKLAGQI